ncbi:DNA-binding protein [Janthinobacterium sp. PSPC3-1]|uniref:DNA-binding protein n=1 Tax=Janthinobacterium sp. PSPC3-1 TaxID=2804653 RepID=UPI003CE68841
MTLSPEVYERISTAADALHAQGGGQAFPTVDAVRKAARVSMNDASAGMREWRRSHTVQAGMAATSVPDKIRGAGLAALAGVWNEAQALAGESLRLAHMAWEAERGEAETLARQMADAYEAVLAELQACQGQLASTQGEVRDLVQQKETMATTLAEAQAAAALAAARAQEIERRALELRAELDHAHQATAQARAELAQAHVTSRNEMNAAKAEAAALARQGARK